MRFTILQNNICPPIRRTAPPNAALDFKIDLAHKSYFKLYYSILFYFILFLLSLCVPIGTHPHEVRNTSAVRVVSFIIGEGVSRKDLMRSFGTKARQIQITPRPTLLIVFFLIYFLKKRCICARLAMWVQGEALLFIYTFVTKFLYL